MTEHAAPSLLTELRDDGHGRLLYRGSRFLLIRPETLVAVQRAVEAAAGPGAAECFAAGGRAGGARATAAVAGEARERLDRLVRMGRELGWGEFGVESWSRDQLVITVKHSPFAEAHDRSQGPVCHLIRGVVESFAAELLGRRMRASETSCEAAGGPICRFEARA
jgi:predicted hydrocarbon binding protein